MGLKTPLLLLTYNRPKQTAIVWDTIRLIKPEHIFVSADGEHIDKCKEVRDICIPDWKCEFRTNYGMRKLGCKGGVLKGIDWFFKHVDKGIILEDDCLPLDGFFDFMEYHLEKHEKNQKVWQVAGWSDIYETQFESDYEFTKHIHCWGWGTWADRWNQWEEIGDYSKFPEHLKVKYESGFERTKNGLDAWDYQWVYTILKNNGYSVQSNKKLIKNIGFGLDATHTKNPFKRDK
jgi:hypothetical protein